MASKPSNTSHDNTVSESKPIVSDLSAVITPTPFIITAYLQDLIKHLKNTDSAQSADQPKPLNLLLVADSVISSQILPNLENSLNTFAPVDIDIHIMTPKEFLSADFDKRYDLGCYLADSLSLISLTSSHVADCNKEAVRDDKLTAQIIATQTSNELNDEAQNVALISTRLRDLFAHQCVMMLDHALSSKVNLRALGYVTALDSNSDIKGMVIWQFNLYNYKPEPVWLNARYWANPENFNKYRW